MPTRRPGHPDLAARKSPRQARSREMVEVILEAAARVLRRESLAGFTTNRVAEVAGISVGSLYQYFPNKAALVAALLERAHEALADAVEATIERTAGLPARAALRELAALAVEEQYGDPVLAAALDHEEKRLPIGPQLKAANERLGRAVASFLDRHWPMLPAVAAQDCLTIARALVEEDSDRHRAPPADLVIRVERALWGYVTTQAEAMQPQPATPSRSRGKRQDADPR